MSHPTRCEREKFGFRTALAHPVGRMVAGVTLFLAFSVTQVAAQRLRQWSTQDGRFSVKATLLDVQDDDVVLRYEDGRKRRVPLARLSDVDRRYAKAWVEGAAAREAAERRAAERRAAAERDTAGRKSAERKAAEREAAARHVAERKAAELRASLEELNNPATHPVLSADIEYPIVLTLPQGKYGSSPHDYAFDPTVTQFVTLGGGTVVQWDLLTGKPIDTWEPPLVNSVDPLGRYVVRESVLKYVGGRVPVPDPHRKFLEIHDIQTKTKVFQSSSVMPNPIFTPDGRWLVAWEYIEPPAGVPDIDKARQNWNQAQANWHRAEADWENRDNAGENLAKARVKWRKARVTWAEAQETWTKAEANWTKAQDAWTMERATRESGITVIDLETFEQFAIGRRPGGLQPKIGSYHGNRLATQSKDGIHVFDLESREEVSTIAKGSYALAIGPDGRFLATSHSLIEVDTKRLTTIKYQDKERRTAAFSRGGRLVAFAAGRSIQLWDAVANRAVRTWQAHNDPISEIVFSNDGSMLVTAERDAEPPKVWDVGSGQLIAKLESAHNSYNAHLKFTMSPLGELLAARGPSEVQIWNLAHLKARWEADKPVEREAAEINVAEVAEPLENLKDPAAPPVAGVDIDFPIVVRMPKGAEADDYAFDPTLTRFVTLGGGSVVQWDLATGNQIDAWELPEASSLDLLARYVVCASNMAAIDPNQRYLEIYDIETRKKLFAPRIVMPNPTFVTARFLVGGRLEDIGKAREKWDEAKKNLLKAQQDFSRIRGGARVRAQLMANLAKAQKDSAQAERNWSEIRRRGFSQSSELTVINLVTFQHFTMGGQIRNLHSLISNSSGSRLAAINNDGKICVGDLESREKFSTIATHGSSLPIRGTPLAISPDGRFLVTRTLIEIDTGRSTRFIDPNNPNNLQDMHDRVTAAAFSRDGRMLAFADDRSIQLWDPVASRAVRAWETDGNPIQEIVFSNDGSMLVTAGRDVGQRYGNVNVQPPRVFDVATGQLIATLGSDEYPHDHSFDLTLSSRGDLLAARGGPGEVRIWNLALLKQRWEENKPPNFDPAGDHFDSPPLYHALLRGIPSSVTGFKLAHQANFNRLMEVPDEKLDTPPAELSFADPPSSGRTTIVQNMTTRYLKGPKLITPRVFVRGSMKLRGRDVGFLVADGLKDFEEGRMVGGVNLGQLHYRTEGELTYGVLSSGYRVEAVVMLVDDRTLFYTLARGSGYGGPASIDAIIEVARQFAVEPSATAQKLDRRLPDSIGIWMGTSDEMSDQSTLLVASYVAQWMIRALLGDKAFALTEFQIRDALKESIPEALRAAALDLGEVMLPDLDPTQEPGWVRFTDDERERFVAGLMQLVKRMFSGGDVKSYLASISASDIVQFDVELQTGSKDTALEIGKQIDELRRLIADSWVATESMPREAHYLRSVSVEAQGESDGTTLRYRWRVDSDDFAQDPWGVPLPTGWHSWLR